MSENWKQITEFVEKYNNTLVLDGSEVKVLRGCSDGNDDYYWILQDIKGNFIKLSCVGSITPLKEYFPKAEYEGLVYYFQINLNKISRKIE